MSAISNAKSNYDTTLAAYGANPQTATLSQVAAALQALVAAIAGTSPAPTTDPDMTTYGNLASYQAQLAADQEAEIAALQATTTSQAAQISAIVPADSYESASAAETSTAGVKYYQVAVPNFSAITAPSGVPAPSNYVSADGATASNAMPSLSSPSSFLRLGSSPDTSEWSSAAFQNSVNLARLVGDPRAIAKSEGMSVATSSTVLTGNVDSPNASTLVFKRPTTAVFYNEGQPTTASTASLSGSFQDAFSDGNPPTEGTPWDGTAFGSAQDPNFLLGFADDTRWRGTPEVAGSIVSDTTNNLGTNNNVLNPVSTLINNTAVPNVNANRQAETLSLLTKGGWWDHSDGNRVSTTMGDKIEVIQGNYKLVVLGRQPAPVAPPLSNVVDLQALLKSIPTLLDTLETWYNAQTAANLAAVQALLPSGTTADDVSVRFKYQVDVWLMTQNTFITDMSGGHFQEQYPSPTPCIKTVEYSQDNNNEWTLYQDNTQGNLITRLKGKTVDLFQGSSRETYVGSADPTILWTTDQSPATTPPTVPSTTNALRLDPMVASYTWAQSVYSQTGSASKPVGFGTPKNGGSSTSGNPSTSSTTAGPQPTAVSGGISVGNGDVVSATWANRVASYVGSSGSTVGTVYSETHAGTVTGKTFADHVISVTTAIDVTTEVGAKAVVTSATQAGALIANSSIAGGEIFALNVAGGVIPRAGITTLNLSPAGIILTLNATPMGIINIDATTAGSNVHVGTEQRNIHTDAAKIALNYQLSTLRAVLTCGIWQCATGRFLVSAPNVQLGVPPAPPPVAVLQPPPQPVVAWAPPGAPV